MLTEHPTRRSLWRSIAMWQLTGIGLATIVLAAIGVVHLATARPGLPLTAWPGAFAAAAIWILIPGLLIVPLSLSGLFLWARLVRRWPRLEASYALLLGGLLTLGLGLALLAGAISSWESLVGRANESFISSTTGIAADVLPGVLLGLLLPRLTLPSLRLGVFLSDSRAAAV